MFSTLYKLKRNFYIKNYAFHACLVLGCFYGFYQLFADSGILTLYKLQQTIKKQEQENKLLEKRKLYLESRVQKLKNGDHFDYDYLDEIIRSKLGVIKESEKVIYVENLKS